MLVDGVEAEKAQQDRKDLIAEKNKQMDLKLAKIKLEKQNAQQQKQEAQLQKNRDEKSGIILRKDTRVHSEDEIMGKVGSRDFIPVEKMDDIETRLKYQEKN